MNERTTGLVRSVSDSRPTVSLDATLAPVNGDESLRNETRRTMAGRDLATVTEPNATSRYRTNWTLISVSRTNTRSMS